MRHSRIVETSDNVNKGINITDIGKKLISLGMAAAFREPGYVDHFNRGGNDFCRMDEFVDLIKPGIGDIHSAQVRLGGCEGSFMYFGPVRGDTIEEAGFS
jgi:hypothetical protein